MQLTETYTHITLINNSHNSKKIFDSDKYHDNSNIWYNSKIPSANIYRLPSSKTPETSTMYAAYMSVSFIKRMRCPSEKKLDYFQELWLFLRRDESLGLVQYKTHKLPKVKNRCIIFDRLTTTSIVRSNLLPRDF